MVLGLERTSVPKMIVRATAIVNAMSAAKTTFPNPTPTLAQVTSDINALIEAETALKKSMSGEVQLVAKATKGATANEWQYSTDGGKTWVDLSSTSKATITVSNLTPGTTVMFRHRVLTKAGHSDWSDASSLLVV